MPKHRSTGRVEPDDAAADAEAFRAAVRGVKPLAQAPVVPIPRKPRPRAPRRDAAVSMENLDEVMPLIGAEQVSGEAALSFHRGGVRLQVLRRLRRGLYPIEGELDLHGLTQSAARDRLADFIVRSRDEGRRCVRIIHGKGSRSGSRGAVLKAGVNLWLRRHMDVLAFVSARAMDGGAGAMYVLLRA